MPIETLLIILVIGAVAGWLAGLIVQGTGFGLLTDLVVGIIGAIIGNWLLPKLGIRLGTGIVAVILAATIGAVLFLLVAGLFARSRGYRGGGGRFRLTPPTIPVFIISLVLAIAALLAHYAGVRIPSVTAARAFDLLAIAY